MFRFSGFNDLNKENQTELKKEFNSTITTNQKREGDKTSSSTRDNDEASKAKRRKTEEKNRFNI